MSHVFQNTFWAIILAKTNIERLISFSNVTLSYQTLGETQARTVIEFAQS